MNNNYIVNHKAPFVQFKDGTWGINTTITDERGNRHHLNKKGYRTLKEARLDFESSKERLIEKRTSQKADTTFEQFLKTYETNFRGLKVRQTTIESDNSVYETHFLPYFKGMSAKKVFNEDNIGQWNKLVLSKALSVERKNKIIERMKDLIEYAYLKDLIGDGIHKSCIGSLIKAKETEAKKGERAVWNEEELKMFLGLYEKGSDMWLRYNLLANLGTRISEFLAITPSNIDFDTNSIEIRNQAQNLRGKGTIITSLKTLTSYRKIYISQDMANELKKYIEREKLKPTDYINHSPKEKDYPLAKTTFKRQLKRDIQKANLKPITAHAFRHMLAVRLGKMCETMSDIEMCARQLGHSPSMFLNTYANHETEKAKQKMLMAMAI